MTGFDDDDDWPDEFRPVPHPDDRLWRHPAEVAAARAAANGGSAEPTVEMPTVLSTGRSRDGGPLRVHWGVLAVAVAVAVGASALSIGILTARSDDVALDSPPANAVLPIAAPGGLSEIPAADITHATAPSAVSGPEHDLHAEFADALPRVQAATSTGMVEGSGVFVSTDGLLVTSASLVSHSDYILAWTNDGRRMHAEVIAADVFSDVAVLRVDTDQTIAATFSDRALLPWTGQPAMVIDHNVRKMTVGHVESSTASATGAWPGDESTRMALGAGALPGSAVLDEQGRVIAMVNLATDADNGRLHATPAWMIERVVNELLDFGVAHHPWLGVQATADIDGRTSIVRVADDSPASVAGLLPGDVIDAIDGTPLNESISLWTLVQLHEPGDRVELQVTRNGDRRMVSATLGRLGE